MSSQFRSKDRREAKKYRMIVESTSINGADRGAEGRSCEGLSGFAVAAFLVSALHAAAGLLADFFDKERGAAGRTGLGNGTVPQGKFAGRIFATGKERTAFARPLLDKIPAATRLRTFHAE